MTKKTLSKIQLFTGQKTFPKAHRKSQPAFTLIELLVTISIFVAFLTVVANSYLNIVKAQRSANDLRRAYSDLRNFVDMVNDEMRGGTIDYQCNPEKLVQAQLSTSSNLEDLLLEKAENQSLSYKTQIDIKDFQRCSFDTNAFIGGDLKNILRIVSKDGQHSTIFKFEPSGSSSGTPDSLQSELPSVSGGKIKVLKLSRINNTWTYADGYAPGSQGVDSLGYQELLFSGLNIDTLVFDVFPLKNPQEQKELKYQFQPFVSMSLEVKVNAGPTPLSLDFQTTISSRVYQ